MSAGPGPRRLHPISIVQSSLRALPGAFIGMIGVFGALVQRNPLLAVMLAIVPVVIALGASALSWWRFTYDVRDGEIVIERGLLGRQRRVIPFGRVRDIAIEQKLLARIVGTAKVGIETGGAKADEGVLDMIELDAAQALRERIRRANLTGASAVAATEAAQAEPPEPVIFAMSVGRVLGSGLLNFSLIFIAVAFGALQYLEDLNIIDLDRLTGTGGARGLIGMFTVKTALVILGLLMLLGLISGVIRTLLRDYGFTLTASETGLRRRRGLVTLSEVLIPARRTEAARIETGLIGGALGWHGLSFQTLGADAKEGGVQVAAPFARMDEIARIMAEAGFPMPPGVRMVRPPALALVRRCLAPLVVAVPIVAAAQFWALAWWGMALPALMLVHGVGSWLREGHVAGDSALFMRSGFLTTRLWIMPYEKLQTVGTQRGPLQRPLGLATVAPDTAGASSFEAPRVADLRRGDAEALAARILAAFYEARARLRAAHPARLSRNGR